MNGKRFQGGVVVTATVLATSLSLASTALAKASPVKEALVEAEQLATEADASAAIGAYRDLVRGGTDSASVRFNLGTLYLESGDLARAVFHLKTALAFDPTFDDARHNLRVAVSARADSVSDVTKNRVSFLSFGRRIPHGATATAFGLLMLFLGLALGARDWLRAPLLRRVLATASAVTAVIALAAGVGLVARVRADGVVEAVVLNDEISARLGPSEEAKESFIAHAGLAGSVMETRGEFVRLRLDNGLEAWLPRGALAFVDGSSTIP